MYKKVLGTFDDSGWNSAKDQLGSYLKWAMEFVPDLVRDLIEEIKDIVGVLTVNSVIAGRSIIVRKSICCREDHDASRQKEW